MPARAPRPCRERLCPNTTTERSGYCGNHSDLSGWGKWQGGESAAKRGYGKEWQRLRIEVLERDNYLCKICLKNNVVTQAREVDHIKPKSKGGTDDPNNLQSVCTPCHAVKTAAEGKS